MKSQIALPPSMNYIWITVCKQNGFTDRIQEVDQDVTRDTHLLRLQQHQLEECEKKEQQYPQFVPAQPDLCELLSFCSLTPSCSIRHSLRSIFAFGAFA